MASREIRAVVDLIGKPQFARLVEFLNEVEDYARLTADDELREKVARARDDLAGMH
jgi:hypothetical protein